MTRSRNGIGIRTLGELDIDILNVVWKMERATVKDVFEELYETRRLAYTTIMTVMGRLAKKGVLKQDRSRTPYVYTPLMARQELALSIIHHVIDRLLDGAPDQVIDNLGGRLEPQVPSAKLIV
jgi:predicted transcriptional regulator